MPTASRLAFAALLLAAAGRVPAAWAQCGAAGLCAASADPCVVSTNCDVPAATYDLGTRSLVINANLRFQGAGSAVVMAHDITIQRNGAILAMGDTADPANTGGDLQLVATGAVSVEKVGGADGEIRVGGAAGGGTFTVTATGDVVVQGRILAKPTGASGDGGEVTLHAVDGDVVVDNASSTIAIDAQAGSSNDSGGNVLLVSDGGDVKVMGKVLASKGACGDCEVDLLAGRDVIVSPAGRVEVDSSTDEGDDGGSVVVQAGRHVDIGGVLSAKGAGEEGGGGDIDLSSTGAGHVSVVADLDASGVQGGDGGFFTIGTAGTITVAGIVHLEGNGADTLGGDATIGEDLVGLPSDVTITGTVSATGFGAGGAIDVAATGAILLQGRLLADGEVGSVHLRGCTVTVAPTGTLSAQPSGVNLVRTGSLAIIEGTLRATPAGENRLEYRDQQPSVAGIANVQPTAQQLQDATVPCCVSCPPTTSTTTSTSTSTTTSITTAPTTTTTTLVATTSTTEVPTTSTTTSTGVTGTTVPQLFVLDFQVVQATGACGRVSGDTGGTDTLIELGCGDLDVGGGGSAALPGAPFPGGSISRFGLANCGAGVCDIVATDLSVQTGVIDCTTSGCSFGLPMPIGGDPTSCVLHTLAAPVSGSIDVATGAVDDLQLSLSSTVYVSGTYTIDRGAGATSEPCPVCADRVDALHGSHPVSGTPSAPAGGTCSGGPRAGEPCTSQNSAGLSHDCPPGGRAVVDDQTLDRPCAANPAEGCVDALGQTAMNVGALPLDLSLSTGTPSMASTGTGLFCQDLVPAPVEPGCFNAEFLRQLPGGPVDGSACRSIAAAGVPFGDLIAGTKPGTLASVFCVRRTGDVLLDALADLPGPGAVTLPGMLTVSPLSASTTTLASTTTTTTTTSTSTPSTTTTTTATATTSSTTTAPSSTSTTSSTTPTTSSTVTTSPTTTTSTSTTATTSSTSSTATTGAPTTSTTVGPTTTTAPPTTTTTSTSSSTTAPTVPTVPTTTTVPAPASCEDRALDGYDAVRCRLGLVEGILDGQDAPTLGGTRTERKLKAQVARARTALAKAQGGRRVRPSLRRASKQLRAFQRTVAVAIRRGMPDELAGRLRGLASGAASFLGAIPRAVSGAGMRHSGSSPKWARVMRSFRYSSVPRSSMMSPPVS